MPVWHQGEAALYVRPDAISLTQGRERVYTFAPDGRPLAMFKSGDFYQRGLDNRWLYKGRQQGERVRRLLPPEQAGSLLAELRAELQNLSRQAQPASPAESWFADLLAWTPEHLAANAAEFSRIYAPVSILPPDQYTSLVLQLSEGCSYNRCSFCNFYKQRRFRIKSLAEFDQHIADVKRFLGRQQRLRRGIFLADGDALMVPQPRLRASVAAARKAFGSLPVFSFMDAFRPQAKSADDFAELAELGFARIYLGIETGDAKLLDWLEKPGSPALMRAEALKIKQAGLSLGLILMIGAGGRPFAASHRRASLDWLASLPLTRDDRIFLSEFVPHADQPYAAKAAAAGFEPLTNAELRNEVGRWRAGLRGTAAKVVPYHLQEFLY